jgi:hypothetical protein
MKHGQQRILAETGIYSNNKKGKERLPLAFVPAVLSPKPTSRLSELFLPPKSTDKTVKSTVSINKHGLFRDSRFSPMDERGIVRKSA